MKNRKKKKKEKIIANILPGSIVSLLRSADEEFVLYSYSEYELPSLTRWMTMKNKLMISLSQTPLCFEV